MNQNHLIKTLITSGIGLIIGIGITNYMPHAIHAADQATVQSSQATTSVNKTELKNEISQANKIEPDIKSYAKISQDRVNRALDMANTLEKSSQATQTQVDTVASLLKSALTSNNLVKSTPTHHDSIPIGKTFTDTEGAPIQAHGGGFLKQTDTDGTPIYYWVGEDKSHNASSFNGITLYSSKDLLNWTYRKTILTPSLTNKGLSSNKIERPKILYNNKTKKFVVWGHWEDQANYTSSQICVATSDTVDGDYKFLGHWRPGADSTHRDWRLKTTTGTNREAVWDKDGSKIGDSTTVSDTNIWGTPSRDFTLYQDGNNAYLISSAGKDMNVFKLNDDFTDVEKGSNYTLFDNYREAPAMIKSGKYFFLITSSQSGWNPNQASYAYTTDISNKDSWVKPTTDKPLYLGDNTAFFSQSTNIMQVGTTSNPEYLYMGDRWHADQLGSSTYVWLPLNINGTNSSSPSMDLEFKPDWTLDSTTNQIKETPSKLLSQGKPATTNAKNSGGNTFDLKAANDGKYTSAAPTFNPVKSDGKTSLVPYTYTVDLQNIYNLSRVNISFKNAASVPDYTIETSTDNKTWHKVVDRSNNTADQITGDIGFTSDKLSGQARYVRLTVTNTNNNNAGLREFQVYGTDVSNNDNSNSSSTTVTPNESSSSETSSSTSSNTSSSSSASPSSSTTSSSSSSSVTSPNKVKVSETVYATRSIYMYKSANFKHNQRIAAYPKRTRANRPMFVVIGYARSSNGTLRFKVKDVNHGSKTAGKVGYITANSKFISPVYYASLPKSKVITVISKRGINVYKSTSFKGKVKHYKRGTHLKVKAVKKYHLTSRYQLGNGNYITGNKKLIIQGKH